MKTFNIWKLDLSHHGQTGPWVFMSACLALNEADAIETAKMRHGSESHYKVYEGLGVA